MKTLTMNKWLRLCTNRVRTDKKARVYTGFFVREGKEHKSEKGADERDMSFYD